MREHAEVTFNGGTVVALLDMDDQGRITYEEVLRNNPHPEYLPTVAFRKGPSERPAGTLTPGESVRVVPGMIFDIAVTGGA